MTSGNHFSTRHRTPFHKVRRHDALAVAAHADAALDEHFPLTTPCLICGVPGMPQRHRVVDSIAGAIAADQGDTDADLAEESGVSAEAVRAVRLWMERWAGAWR